MKEMQDQHPDMTLGTGKLIWFAHPHLTTLVMADFETPVQNICRYNGAIDWRLVKHLMLGGELADLHFSDVLGVRDLELCKGYFQAHDLHECIVGDMVSGMKPYHATYRRMEEVWEIHVHEQIGLPLDRYADRHTTKVLDQRALAVEMYMLKHPAAERVLPRFGGPLTPAEEEAFTKVQNTSLADAWKYVVRTVEEAIG
jgi:hypothetical protein